MPTNAACITIFVSPIPLKKHGATLRTSVMTPPNIKMLKYVFWYSSWSAGRFSMPKSQCPTGIVKYRSGTQTSET